MRDDESPPLDLTSRTNVTLEHQVELDRFGELVSGGWVDDFMFTNDVAEFLAVVIVDLQA